MNRSLRAGERGVSVLGALVAALALSAGTAATFELATPSLSSVSSDSQLAQAAAAPKPTTPPKATKDSDDPYVAQQEKACKELREKSAKKGDRDDIEKIKVTKEKGQGAKSSDAGTGKVTEEGGTEAIVDLCISVWKSKSWSEKTKNAPTSYECRGRLSKVQIDGKGSVTSESYPFAGQSKGECRTLECKPDPKSSRDIECVVGITSGGDTLRNTGNFEKDATKITLNKDEFDRLGIGTDLNKQENDALAAALQNAENTNNYYNRLAESAEKRRQDALRALEGCDKCADKAAREQAVKDAEKAANLAKEAQQVSQQRLDNLRDARVALRPDNPGAPGRDGEPETLPDGTIIKRDDKGDVTEVCKDGACKKVGGNTQTPGTNPSGGTPDNSAGNSKSGGGMGDIGSLLKSLGSLFNQQPQQLPCVSDQNQYNQQLQSYQMQLQSYNQQLQQYNYTRQLQSAYGSTGFTPEPPTQPAQPCYKPPSTNTCQQAPAQPNPTGCQNGSWKPTYTGACLSGWQCVPTSGSEGTAIVAQITCKPPVVDVGMSVTIDYSCSAGTSEGGGFETGGVQSGTASVTVANPPAGTNVATFGLKCTNGSGTTTKQCSVQIAKPAIVLVANPKAIAQGKTSAIGWVTSGMKSCVISSPDLSSFTEQHKNSTNVNGTVATPPLSSPASFVLSCTTLGGATKQATTQVSVQ